MTKLPYGGFESDPPDYPDSWAKLNTIAEYLEDGEALPPHLAQWLGRAIRASHRDQARLLVELGLKKTRGGQPTIKDGWLTWGARVCDLEDSGLSPEQAVNKVLEETGDTIPRSTLQLWRDTYRKAEKDSRNIE